MTRRITPTRRTSDFFPGHLTDKGKQLLEEESGSDDEVGEDEDREDEDRGEGEEDKQYPNRKIRRKDWDE